MLETAKKNFQQILGSGGFFGMKKKKGDNA